MRLPAWPFHICRGTPHPDSWRQPLRPGATHGLVREQRDRLPVRPTRQQDSAATRRESADDIAPAALSSSSLRCAAMPRPTSRRNPRRPNAAPELASRQPPSAPTSALSSPISKKAPPSTSTRDLLRPRPGRNLIKMHKTPLASDRTSSHRLPTRPVLSCTPPHTG